MQGGGLAGQLEGVVSSLGLLYTTFARGDDQILVPNSVVLNALTTSDGVVLLDAPPTIRHNIQRAVDEIAAANGVSNEVSHLIYTHHHADHAGASSLFDKNASTCPITTR